MQLKEYQQAALEQFDYWYAALQHHQKESHRRVQAGFNTAHDTNFPAHTWSALQEQNQIPKHDYINRNAAQGAPIPHVCFKVPTGGGKTLLGAATLERIHPLGLVLWIVPSKAIYRQTWKHFATRQDPYRLTLERASGGRVKLLKKDDPISKLDIENYLCIMPIMLQASGGRESNDFLKVFRDSGKYDYFPPTDDWTANQALLTQYPDLHTAEIDDSETIGTVKQSLFNLLKIHRPIIILDEAHNSYSEIRRKRLCEFNPTMVIELSATPNRQVSNILVDIGGEALKHEEMIKLPINVHTLQNADWKTTLSKAVAQQQDLERHAEQENEDNERYIRPIVIVRVERVGKDQRDGTHIHAEDVRDYLVNRLNIPARHIRHKTSEKDEIADEDLTSPYSEVRYILTKDALKEGWDCAFAYILVLLDTTKTPRSLTQMTGRILRQPYTHRTASQPLNECYIFCFNIDVSATIQGIKTELEREGMGDIATQVMSHGEGVAITTKTFHRREKWRERRLFLPQVLYKEETQYRPLEYERDIISTIDWETIIENIDIEQELSDNTLEEVISRIDIGKDTPRTDVYSLEAAAESIADFCANQLIDIVSSSWAAAKIAEYILRELKTTKSPQEIYRGRADIADWLRRTCGYLVEQQSQHIFQRKVETGEIRFELKGDCDFEIPTEVEKQISTDSKILHTKNADRLQRTLFDEQGVCEHEFNGLEKDVALHIDSHSAVMWWHRLVTKGDWYLQGWKRQRVYPDFLVCIEGHRMLVLETKGMHLMGSADTHYKQELLKALEQMAPQALDCGEIELHSDKKSYRMQMSIVPAESWKESVNRLVQRGDS